MFAIGLTFLALYSGTGARLRAQVDTQLRTQADEWRQALTRTPVSDEGGLKRVADRFIAGQSYHPESQIVVVQTAAGDTVTNDQEVLAREQGSPEGGLLASSPGFRTASVPEAGDMRILTLPVVHDGRRLGTFRVAIPLSPVAQAQSSLLRTFGAAAALAVILAIAAGFVIAGFLAAPLRRMARVARTVDAGDLSARVGRLRGRNETSALGEAFDRMLERLERAFGRQRDFVSDASHELRTPLAVLRAQVELLDRETDEEGRRVATALMLSRLDELDRLVGDLLTLASAEGGQLIEPRPIELTGFFEDLRRDLPLFGERRFAVEPVAGTLLADPERLTQMLRNLVRNAVTHTRQGGRVEVRARSLGEWLEITVTDGGPGIPPEELERVFERFRRLSPGRSRDKGGSGLGLAIVRALAEAHGGTVTAESAAPGGATFRIVLPGYTAPGALLALPQLNPPAPAGPAARSHRGNEQLPESAWRERTARPPRP
jgi:signal transduction histidine kinase